VEKSSAILIGRYPLTETSLIVHWCTAEHGLLKTVAKGALRPKSAFAGRLDLFVSADIRWTPSRSADLHTLTEVALSSPRLHLRDSYRRVLAATYLVKLVEMCVERETPVLEIHDLLLKALDYLVTHEPSPALVERFELRLTEALGVSGAGGRPVAALQAMVHKALPVQRAQLWRQMESATGPSL
jgi:DNA repair protein RecO (recombination protein O)